MTLLEQLLTILCLYWKPNIFVLISPLFAGEHRDFARFGQSLNNLSLIVSIMHAGLPELSGIAVLFPVVVPVATAVCSKTKHIHLKKKKESQKVH